jgi:hypothetical protein
MHDLLTNMDEGLILPLAGMLVGVIAILGGVTVAITMVVSAHRRRSQRDEMEATLKMEMIQRGMSADEIAKVLGARMSDRTALGDLLGSLPQLRGAAPFARPCEKT